MSGLAITLERTHAPHDEDHHEARPPTSGPVERVVICSKSSTRRPSGTNIIPEAFPLEDTLFEQIIALSNPATMLARMIHLVDHAHHTDPSRTSCCIFDHPSLQEELSSNKTVQLLNFSMARRLLVHAYRPLNAAQERMYQELKRTGLSEKYSKEARAQYEARVLHDLVPGKEFVVDAEAFIASLWRFIAERARVERVVAELKDIAYGEGQLPPTEVEEARLSAYELKAYIRTLWRELKDKRIVDEVIAGLLRVADKERRVREGRVSGDELLGDGLSDNGTSESRLSEDDELYRLSEDEVEDSDRDFSGASH